MQAVIWKWMVRFFATVIVITVALSLVVGALLRYRLHGAPPAWIGGVLSLVVVLIVGGMMLPAMQRDAAAQRTKDQRRP